MIVKIFRWLFPKRPKIPLITYFEFEELNVMRLRRLIDIALNENDESDPVDDPKFNSMVQSDIWRDGRRARKRSLKYARKIVGRRRFYTIPEVNEILYGKPHVPQESTEELDTEQSESPKTVVATVIDAPRKQEQITAGGDNDW